MADKKPTEDATRESLIALSYSLPDSPDFSSEKVTNNGNNNVPAKEARSEDFRSELISLSYTSPDAISQPQTTG